MVRYPPPGTADRLLLAAIDRGEYYVDKRRDGVYVREAGRAYKVSLRLRQLCALGMAAWVSDGAGDGDFHVTARGRALVRAA